MAAIVFGVGAIINAFARTPEIQVRPTPDAALRQSLRYTTVYFSLSVAIGLIGIAALLGLHHRSSDGTMSTTAAVVGAFGFLGWVGFFFALEKGGYFLLDHFISLRMITRSKAIPPDLRGSWTSAATEHSCAESARATSSSTDSSWITFRGVAQGIRRR